MPNTRTRFIIAGCVLIAGLLYAVRGSIGLLVLGSLSLVVAIFPLIIVVGIAILIVRAIWPSTQRQITTRQMHPSATPIMQRLQSAFRRNHAADLDRALATLPAWPISHQLQETTHVMLALNQSIYRAQAEGVPASIIQRYLSTTQRASESMWALASKLDALGQQPVTYALIAPRLHEEATHLEQLQHSAQAAQDGIALLIVSGIQSGTFQHVDQDLSALTDAVTAFMPTTSIVPHPATDARR
ncbi:MAG: hypothetical protein SH847_25415 [Roseiflexaceae bacterium]|nr:hypothetical protein [Roseiflexaceae bacterium]